MNKGKKVAQTNKEPDKVVQMLLRVPTDLKKNIIQSAAQETIRRKEKISENQFCIEAIEKAIIH